MRPASKMLGECWAAHLRAGDTPWTKGVQMCFWHRPPNKALLGADLDHACDIFLIHVEPHLLDMRTIQKHKLQQILRGLGGIDRICKTVFY